MTVKTTKSNKIFIISARCNQFWQSICVLQQIKQQVQFAVKELCRPDGIRYIKLFLFLQRPVRLQRDTKQYRKQIITYFKQMLVLKDVLRPRLKPGSSGGGKSSNQTSTLQTESNPSNYSTLKYYTLFG